MVQWFTDNWFAVVSLVIAAILACVGLYFGWHGWKRKWLVYHLRGNNIFRGLQHTVPDVEVKFAGYGPTIAALTVSKITFWNAGNETINKSDIVKDDQLRVQVFGDALIMSVRVVGCTSTLNEIECTVTRERTSATITFNYLDHNQGAVIQVFHTGPVTHSVQLRGTIKGVGSISAPRSHNRSPSDYTPTPKWFSRTTGILNNVIFVMQVWTLINWIRFENSVVAWFLLVPVVVLALAFNGLNAWLWYMSRVPRDLAKILRTT
jgi:hypothetical protein